MKINISCSLCSTSLKLETKVPDTWGRVEETDIENALCPKHKVIEDFIENQCPGCVGGWMECGLWTDFAYSEKKLNEDDFDKIRLGICPRRVNGTFMTGHKGFERINLSEQASSQAGKALVEAIESYWEKFSKSYEQP